MAPLIVKGKVLVGNCGGQFGVRGWLTARQADPSKIPANSDGPQRDMNLICSREDKRWLVIHVPDIPPLAGAALPGFAWSEMPFPEADLHEAEQNHSLVRCSRSV
jgi:hypothetical protein